MKELALNFGKVTLVDDEDYDFLALHRWTIKRSYVSTTGLIHTIYAWGRVTPGSRVRTFLHRFLLQPPPGVGLDHVNGDGLDNRRCNLRLCSHHQNAANMRKRPDATSRFKGVSLRRSTGLWIAQLVVHRKWRKLGSFKDELEAARAYDRAAAEAFGPFARLNFPEAKAGA